MGGNIRILFITWYIIVTDIKYQIWKIRCHLPLSSSKPSAKWEGISAVSSSTSSTSWRGSWSEKFYLWIYFWFLYSIVCIHLNPLDNQWTYTQYSLVAKTSSCQVEFETKQWTQKLWNWTHPVCDQSMLRKDFLLSRMIERPYYECRK